MQITKTAFGMWSGGRFMHFGEAVDDDRLIALIRLAHEKGIRTFLTADVYGAGEADTLLGRALEGVPRDSYCLVGAVGHDFYKGQREGSKGFRVSRTSSCVSRASSRAICARRRKNLSRVVARIASISSSCIILTNPVSRPIRFGTEWKN